MCTKKYSKKNRKNGDIELLRFIFCVCVFFFHTQQYILGLPDKSDHFHFSFFSHGNIGVEFFFLVSGYLMAMKIYNNKTEIVDLGKETLSFIINKIISIFPYHFFSFFILLFQIIISMHFDFMEGFKYFIASIPNLFFLEMTGIRFVSHNVVTWYISAMIIAIAILYPLCRKYYSVMVKVVIPVCSLLILGMFVQNDNALSGVFIWLDFGYKGTIRGIVEFGLGVVCFEVARWLRGINISLLGKIIIKIIEVLCYTFVILYIVSDLLDIYEICALALLFIGVTITFSEVVSLKFMNNKICYFLGEISLQIYLSNMIVVRIISNYFVDKSFSFVFFTSIAMCIFFVIIIRYLGGLFKKKILDVRNNIYKNNDQDSLFENDKLDF